MCHEAYSETGPVRSLKTKLTQHRSSGSMTVNDGS